MWIEISQSYNTISILVFLLISYNKRAVQRWTTFTKECISVTVWPEYLEYGWLAVCFENMRPAGLLESWTAPWSPHLTIRSNEDSLQFELTNKASKALHSPPDRDTNSTEEIGAASSALCAATCLRRKESVALTRVWTMYSLSATLTSKGKCSRISSVASNYTNALKRCQQT